jgi:hypothetical protein
MNTLGAASVGSAFIPDILFCLYQLMFAMYFLTLFIINLVPLPSLSWAELWNERL